MASELVMIRNAAVVSDNGEPRTELTFANELAYRYKRDAAVLLANTVRATHGETVSEVLGSGDARRRWPAFDLRKPPLTYLPAPTPAGAESTRTVRSGATNSRRGFSTTSRNVKAARWQLAHMPRKAT